jgi:hypothetical protein
MSFDQQQVTLNVLTPKLTTFEYNGNERSGQGSDDALGSPLRHLLVLSFGL